MARTLTTNLKLILEDSLTSSARYNLERLDSLGETFTVTEGAHVEVRAENKIILRPNATEAGGSGSGGQLDVSTQSQPLDLITLYAQVVQFAGGSLSLSDGSYDVTLNAPTLTSDVSFTLPASDGNSGQVLSTDGAGKFGWTDPAGGQSATYSWAPGDGTVKTISHNFGSSDIIIEIYDNDSQNKVGIDKIEFISNDIVQLTSLNAPNTSGYKVLLKELD